MTTRTRPVRPPAALDEYRLLGDSGLRVSPLCLGTMTFGTDWGWGADEEECRRMLDLYAERGGNFVDTANLYTNGNSEAILGRLLEGRRHRFVLGTKFTHSMRPGDPNAGGNHRKSMVRAVEESLERLRTDYIDLLWVHAWDRLTPLEELLRALDDLVRAGKVLYLGFSDVPAWVVSRADAVAELRGLSPFVALQLEYSLAERSGERSLLPMARELNIAAMAWSPLASGVLTGKYAGETGPEPDRGELVEAKLTERNATIVEALADVARSVDATPAQVALRWVQGRDGVTSTIVGARDVDQLEDNLDSLDVELDDSQGRRLGEASHVDRGFPHDFLDSDMVRGLISGGTQVVA